MQFVEKQHEGLDEDIDLRALENGFVSSHLPPPSLPPSLSSFKWLSIHPTLQSTDICHPSECSWASGA